MYKTARSSLESGFGDELSQEGSAVEDFFSKFVPQLGSAVRRHDEHLADDPTIDLDSMAVCSTAMQPPPRSATQQQKQQQQKQAPRQQPRHRPQQQSSNKGKEVETTNRAGSTSNSAGSTSNSNNNSNNTFHVNEKRDLSMDELSLIVGQLKDGSSYSEKLIGIMLKGLESTLSTNYYRLFVEYGPPDNWLPIVKMNNDNTPFVEFLIKSDLSDQDPSSQLNEYSTQHMALCKYVLGHLREGATRRKHQEVACGDQHAKQRQINSQPQRPQPRAVCSGPKQHCQSLAPIKPVVTSGKENQRSSLPPPMICSTPIAQRHPPPAKRTPQFGSSEFLDDPLNDSKRILPPRACKSSSSVGAYKKYLNFNQK